VHHIDRTWRIRWGWVRYSFGRVKCIRRRLRTRSLVYQFHILEDNMWVITWRDDGYQGLDWMKEYRLYCTLILTVANGGQSHYIGEEFEPRCLKIDLWYLIQTNLFLETCSGDWNWNSKIAETRSSCLVWDRHGGSLPLLEKDWEKIGRGSGGIPGDVPLSYDR